MTKAPEEGEASLDTKDFGFLAVEPSSPTSSPEQESTEKVAAKEKSDNKKRFFFPLRITKAKPAQESQKTTDNPSGRSTKNKYYGHEKFAFVCKANAIQYFLLCWQQSLLSLISLGYLLPWQLEKQKRYLLQNTYLQSHALQWIDRKSWFPVAWILLYCCFAFIGVTAYLQPLWGLLALTGLLVFSPAIYLRSYCRAWGNLVFRDTPFALQLSWRESFSLGIRFSLSVLLSLGLLLPKNIRKLQELLFSKLRYGRIYFRFSSEHRIVSPWLLPYLLLPLGFLAITAVCLEYTANFSMSEQWLFLAGSKPTQILVACGFLFFVSIQLYQDLQINKAANLHLLGSRLRYKASMPQLFTLWLGNLLILVLSCGILWPLVSYRNYQFNLRHWRVMLAKPGGIEDILHKAI